ncbi:Hpt domain-containing protein [Marinoscillum sp.]|uniref:Hpt domain-containing protein n=1 Tax=Marinoscillum sp. TaxID=2024838 RepID=UPI003BAC2AC5
MKNQEPNFSYIESLSAGDQAFQKRLLEVLKAELPVEIADFESFIKDNKLHKAAELVHKIKHKMALLAMDDAYELAVRFENELHENNPKLLTEFNAILEKMTTFLSRLTKT